MVDRDASDKQFNPSSFDDIAELVAVWTSGGSVTASQIVARLRARGVMVRASRSGRHVILDSPQASPGMPPEARRLTLSAIEHEAAGALEQAVEPPIPPSRVIRPPGQALHTVASLFSKRTRERILDPIIADMQLEYCDELAEERPRRFRLWLVQMRAWVAFGEAIFLRTVIGRIITGLSKIV